MKTALSWWRSWLVLALIALTGWQSVGYAADTLAWHSDKDSVDADIQSWSVRQLLEHVAATTGWRVYLDPNAKHTVSAKFKDLPAGDALHALLGDINFMVVPQTTGPSRLYVFRSKRQQATRLIRAPSGPAKPIPNQLVVTLKPGSKTKIEDLARSLHAKIIGRMDSQNAYLLQFQDETATQSARTELASNPDVASVDVNFPVEPPPQVDVGSGSGPDLQLKPKTPDNGNCQLIVGLIDTPIESLGGNTSSFILPQIHVAGDYSQADTTLTHGTAMAATILDAIQAKTGGSTSVKIQPVDVYGNNETTTTFDVANGIVQAVNSGANIINLSLGSTGDSSILRNTIAQVEQQGIPLYAAAGNEPVTTPTYPAAYPGVIAVTASGTDGQLAPYANHGSFVDIMAPGDNVVDYQGQNWLVEGTSTSTALISGTAAGLADSANACADQAQPLLQKSLPHADLLKSN